MPGTLYYHLSDATVVISVAFFLVIAVIKVIAYLKFRLPSLLWFMIGGFWSLAYLPLNEAITLLTKALSQGAGGGPVSGQAAIRGMEIRQVEGLVFSLIGYALTLVFLVLLFRDLRRLVDNQRPAGEVPPAAD
jgi:hypothetical protein